MELIYESIEKWLEAFKDLKIFRVRPTALVDTAYVITTVHWKVALIPPEWLEKAPELKPSLITQAEWERFLDEWTKQYVGRATWYRMKEKI